MHSSEKVKAVQDVKCVQTLFSYTSDSELSIWCKQTEGHLIMRWHCYNFSSFVGIRGLAVFQGHKKREEEEKKTLALQIRANV